MHFDTEFTKAPFESQATITFLPVGHFYDKKSKKRFYEIEIKLKDGKVKRFNSRVVISFAENEQAISAVKGSGCL